MPMQRGKKEIPMKNKKMRIVIPAAAVLVSFASLALAATEGHHGASSEVLLKDFIYRAINFAVLAGILYYFVAKHIKKGMADRRQKIATDLNEARTARAEAEAKYQEICLKLQKASEEIDQIRLSIQEEGEIEKGKIIANARQTAEKIRAEAEKTALREVERARDELRQEASRLAIVLAGELVRKNINPEDQERFVSEYLKNVGELH
jgi:F-type H+-transporting ATPase subunit b